MTTSLVIGTDTPKLVPLRLPTIFDHYAVIRDAVAATAYVEPHELPSLIAKSMKLWEIADLCGVLCISGEPLRLDGDADKVTLPGLSGI